jgi:hypothetical protein
VIKVSIGKAYFVFFFTYFFGNYRCTWTIKWDASFWVKS